MLVRDFQAALIALADTLCKSDSFASIHGEAIRCAGEVLEDHTPPLTTNTYRVLLLLTADLAVNMQEYVHDALQLLTQGTPQQIWGELSEATQTILDQCWPDEGGLTFVGKISIAVVSEGFVYH